MIDDPSEAEEGDDTVEAIAQVQGENSEIFSLLSGGFPATQSNDMNVSTLEENIELLGLLSGVFQPTQKEVTPIGEISEEKTNDDIADVDIIDFQTYDSDEDKERAQLEFAQLFANVPQNNTKQPQVLKSKFIANEAEVEEDEFMNYGGIDGEDFMGINEYEKDMLADNIDVKVNFKAVLDLHR